MRKVLLRMCASIMLACGLIACCAWYVSANSMTWPSGIIKYYDTSEWHDQVTSATEKWNQTGASVRFVRVDNKDDADLIIRSGEAESRKCAERFACATVGWQPVTHAIVRLPTRKEWRTTDNREFIQKVIVHELGHVLGLKHTENKCSIMHQGDLRSMCEPIANMYDQHVDVSPQCTTMLDSNQCVKSSTTKYVCGPMKTDISHLIKRYGGTMNPDYSPQCQSKWVGNQARIRQAEALVEWSRQQLSAEYNRCIHSSTDAERCDQTFNIKWRMNRVFNGYYLKHPLPRMTGAPVASVLPNETPVF